MNFQELRNRCVEALGEFDNQAASGSTAASIGDATILSRLKAKYRVLEREVRNRAPKRNLVAQDFTYASGSDSINIDTGGPSPSLKQADIISLGVVESDLDVSPMMPMSIDQFENWQMLGEWPGAGDGARAYTLQGDLLYVVPKPLVDLTLRALYTADLALDAITIINWASNSPDLFPADHHEVIAVEAALSFARAISQEMVSMLREERNELRQSLLIWATSDRRPGFRRVNEVAR